MPDENIKTHNTFISILLFSCLIVISTSFYFFFYKKDYTFLVETQCNPQTQTCFYRDCSIEGDCPPNNLSYYNKYNLSAKDFELCVEGDCTDACALNTILCEKIECTSLDFEEGMCVNEIITDGIEIEN